MAPSGPPSSSSGRTSALPDIEAPAEVYKPWVHADNAVSTGLRIVFKDLTYSVPSTQVKGEQAALLKNVSAYFEPNQMAALMGPSGSGKTTLLDLLAGRKTIGKTEGTLVFGGQRPSPAFLRRYTGYVEQFDTLLGTLTVEEMLLYTAELKRPRQEPQSSKREAVDKLIEKLALGRCRSVKIGDGMNKGISGGQAKRTNIGIALITNPRILFLDEPTSGLDSFTANEVMKVVKGLARDGTTICATIHSPTAATFALFDRVLMLARGEVIYFGVQGEAAIKFALASWEAARAALPAGGAAIANDAEWLVDIVTEADIEGKGSELAKAYTDSYLKKENDAQIDVHLGADSAVQLSEDVRRELAVSSSTATPWWWGVGVLIKYRSVRNFYNPAWLGPRMADKLLVSLIILTLYLGIGDDMSGTNLVNIQSMLFMWCLLPAFGATSYVPAIVLERRLFVRERADGLYRAYAYFTFKLAEEITLALLLSLAFASFVFYGVQLQGAFVLFWLVYFIDLCLGIVLAYGIAAVAPNMDVANAAVPAYVVTLLFFAGQLITFSSMPDYWYWYSRVDALRYAWSALMINQFKKDDPVFSGSQTTLQYYSLDGVDKWAQVGYLAVFFFAFATFALLALTFIKHQKR